MLLQYFRVCGFTNAVASLSIHTCLYLELMNSAVQVS